LSIEKALHALSLQAIQMSQLNTETLDSQS